LSTRRRLLLVGAGGLARETLELIAALDGPWDVELLDDNPDMHGRELLGVTITGPSDAVHDDPDALVVAAVATPADPGRRLRLVERLGLEEERYATLIHPAAVVPRSVTVGPGSIVHATSVLTVDIELGSHACLMPGVILTHDDVVEPGVTFGAGVRVAGGVRIGAGAYIGSGALLRESIAVGAGAVVGMGAVVTRDVPAGEVWAGVPARRLSAG
jgi:sugar O-acyltransferase (sialic acid O-acetyltransferase NeuD family)